MTSEEVNALIMKAKMLGAYKSIGTACGKNCMLISISDENHILVIPDEVRLINGSEAQYLNKDLRFTLELQKYRGNLKVVGGNGLTDTSFMFYRTNFDNIDFSEFNTIKVRKMKSMFDHCNAIYIDLRNIKTNSCITMESMFEMCDCEELDLSKFDVRQVRNMSNMFSECQADLIDISSFDKNIVSTMEFMFDSVHAEVLGLRKLCTSYVRSMTSMFQDSSIPYIDASNFDFRSLKYIDSMFSGCQSKEIRLRGNNLDLSRVTDNANSNLANLGNRYTNVFSNSEAVVETDSKDIMNLIKQSKCHVEIVEKHWQ